MDQIEIKRMNKQQNMGNKRQRKASDVTSGVLNEN